MESTRYQVRPVRPGEWRSLRELRLAALADPVAIVAFGQTYAQALEQSDDVWRRQAREGAGGPFGVTFVGLAGEEWAGMMVARLDLSPGAASLVGVYLRPDHRGTGLAGQLFDRVTAWSWAQPDVRRMVLNVHEGNPRAVAFYKRRGFVPTGLGEPDVDDPSAYTYEMELLPTG